MKETRLARRLFPDHAETYPEWGYLNLNDMAVRASALLGVGPADPNPFLLPSVTDEWVRFMTETSGVDHTWGGWLEDRKDVWRGHYQKQGETVHLGVDYNVPAGTRVCLPVWGKLVHSSLDGDQDGGWGGKLVFECAGYHLVFGHLKDIPSDVGTKYSPGEYLGTVAGADCNGGWYPHLHVQATRVFLPDVDGYGPAYGGVEVDFPDPERVTGLRA